MSADLRLSDHEKALYSRQMRLPGVGEAGQLRLREAKVLLLGAGGLGSPVGLYLAAAGVGLIGIADPDKVEVSNLHRQIIHGFDTLGLPKTVSAAESLGEINPGLKVALHPEGFTVENAAELVSRYDVVIDGTDNFATRFLAADACVLGRRPLVHGSVLRGTGQVGVFLPGAGCYRCLYPVIPDAASVPTCADAGVFGATCGVIGSWMASEAIAVVLGRRRQSRLCVVDVEAGSSRPLAILPDPACPCCGASATIRTLDKTAYAPVVCAPPSPVMSATPLEISVEEASRLLAGPNPPVLLDVREPDEYAVCRIEGSRLIPMNTVPTRLAEIPADAWVLVQCHHGGRSMRVTQFLRSKGFARVTNLQGGIDAWSLKVDPKVPRY
ncbi:MAG: molybdenum cofactor biosynthesis protein MoeB [Verrucomicrobia bacterium]|nr:molybdenum cofactor biosynthesis protein MoeB [Verrucomicrobiota bacterium]